MAIDTPAKIAVLGAGPIGLEAALYARFLGYEVVIFDRGEVADSVRQWGHIRMFTPFAMNRSPLGLAAVQTQDEQYTPPTDDTVLTGNEWISRYLLPLSQTDLLFDSIRTQTTVLSIAKEELLKADISGHQDRGDWPFRLLVQGPDGSERVETADCVLDCSGVFANHNWLGQGGQPAIGERAVREQIEYRLPDFAAAKAQYAGRSTLVIGGGYSAAQNVVALAELSRNSPGTSITWITRREGAAGAGPISEIADDKLPERRRLAKAANELARDSSSPVKHFPSTVVERITRPSASGPFEVELSGVQGGSFTFDIVIANVGFRPDVEVFRELQIHQCYASEGPMKLAAAMLDQKSTDCLAQHSAGPQTLLNPEPNYYVLGAKSYGRKSNFLFSLGLEQIRDVFKIIGDRETLDLYQGAKSLPR